MKLCRGSGGGSVVAVIVLSLYLSGWFHTVQHLLITSLAWPKTLCLFELAAFQA